MKIVIATGGSGGHVFPAIDVANALKREGHVVRFIGVFKSFRDKVLQQGYPLEEISARGLSTKSLKTILGSSCSMIKSIVESFRILKNDRPDAVLGFGGYGAFPVVFSASLLKVPTVIHEQNVIPGRANRVLSKFVSKVAVSFEKSQQYFQKDKTVLTGCPCRTTNGSLNRDELLKKFGLTPGQFIILVLGGSQGSQRINRDFMQASKLLKDLLDFQVIHISGSADCEELKRAYEESNIRHCIFSFLDEVEQAYALADLVISRAGAVTVTEIASFRKPAILIPYPLAGGHQKENALILVERQTAEMVEEKDLSPEKFKELILSFAQNQVQRQDMDLKLKGICRPDAVDLVAHAMTNLMPSQ